MSTSKVLQLGGVGTAPSLDEVVKVAFGMHVALDSVGADRVKKESPLPKAFQAELDGAVEPSLASSAVGRLLNVEEARAAIAARLITIMTGRSGVRLQVAEFLCHLLNKGVVPALPSTSGPGAMAPLADACKGLGVTFSGKPLAGLLADHAIPVPGISSSERMVLSSSHTAAAGIGSLVVISSRKLLSAATAVAALSLESAGVQAYHLDAAEQELVGNKASAAAAEELRGLLEGSKAVGSKKGCTPEQQQLYTTLPQSLGAAATALSASYDAVRVEVQAGALPCKAGCAPPPASPHLPVTLTAAARSLLALTTTSLARADLLASTLVRSSSSWGPVVGLQQAVQEVGCVVVPKAQAQLRCVGEMLLDDQESWPGVEAALALGSVAEALHQALALEALAAVLLLKEKEGPATHAATAANSEQGNQPNNEDRKKDKKKDKNMSGLTWGKGTSLVKAHVAGAAAVSVPQLAAAGELLSSQSLAAGSAGEDSEGGNAPGAVPAAVAAVQALLDPSGAQLDKLLEEVKGVVEANQARRKPKVPKGARDFLPQQMAIREKAFNVITSVFKRHGAVGIDTPVFELRETLMGKYGEDSKLIYDLADQGGEILSLRYDLTVPFARYVAVQGIGNIKRYHIGKVYRRDQPQMNRGRFREFFQCDFDIAGHYVNAMMVPDAEVLKVLVEILTELKLGKFTVKLNHRKLLDAMLDIAGVPPQKFRAICSAIDKLDKESWETVRAEMTEEKGLPAYVADKIGEFVQHKGSPCKLLSVLRAPDHPLAQHPSSAAALAELSTLFDFLTGMDALGPISFDLSLARGLDYYTGVIYEAVLEGANVGSIAAGGRYDKLVGMFSGKDVPAVGVSIGIERVFSIMEAQAREMAAAAGGTIRATETEVLVASIGNGLQVKRMEVCSKLWSAGIKAEFGFKPNPKMGDQLAYALEQGIPFLVLFGEDEVQQGVVKVKNMVAKEEHSVPLHSLVADLQQKLAMQSREGCSPGL